MGRSAVLPTLRLDSREQLQAHVGADDGCFVAVSAAPGSVVAFEVLMPRQPPLRLAGHVDRADRDPAGVEGVRVRLDLPSQAAFTQRLKDLAGPGRLPTLPTITPSVAAYQPPLPSAPVARPSLPVIAPPVAPVQALPPPAPAPAPAPAPELAAEVEPVVLGSALPPPPLPPAPSAPAGEVRLEPGTVVDGRYHIDAHLATGGMGEVYRASQVQLKRPVALKVLRASFAADKEMWGRFQREAELVSQLESPHVVRIFDFGRTDDGRPYLAMELVEGETVSKHVRRGVLDPARAIWVVQQVCEGLAEAHGLGVIHRDLKPANLIIGRRRDGTEVVKVLDFGIARLTDAPAQQGEQLTRVGFVVGTPSYLAPEQALAADVDQRTDIYALGCVAYELLTGKPPFKDKDLAKVVSMHLTQAPEPLEVKRPELAAWPGLCAAILKALAKERALRFSSVREFAQALAADLTAPPPSAPRPSATAQAAAFVPPASSPSGFRLTPQLSGDLQATPAPVGLDSGLGYVPRGTPLPSAAGLTPRPSTPASRAAASQGLSPTPWPAPAGGPTPRRAPSVEALVAALASPRAQERLQRARDALDGVRRGVFAYVELVGAPQGTPGWHGAMARVLDVVGAFGGFVDARDEDGVLFGFTSAAWLPAARAACALLALGDAVAEESAGSLKVRGALVTAELTPGGAALSGDALSRAHALAARFQAGQLVTQKVLAQDLAPLVNTKSTYAADVLQLVDRVARPAAAVELVGRASALALVDDRLQRLGAGQGLPLVVSGPERSGRSSLAVELQVRAKRRGLGGWVVSAQPWWRTVPNSVLAAAICAVCDVPLELRAARLRPALEALRLPGPAVEAALVAAGVTHTPWAFTAGQLAGALRAVLRGRAGEAPCFVVFDGLEHADAAALDAVAELTRAPAPNELVVLLGTPDALAGRFESAQRTSLEPLDEPQLTALARAVLGSAPGPKLLAALKERTGGLPGPATDWLAVLEARGALATKGQVTGLVDDLPELSPGEVLALRLELLPPESARLLEAAAALGETFETAMIPKAWPRASQAAVAAISGARLVTPSWGRRWTFASAQVRTAVEQLATRHTVGMHGRLALACFEQAKADPSSVGPLEVARHLVLAKEGAKAVPLLQQAAQQALGQRAVREAARALEALAEAHAAVGVTNAAAQVEALCRAASCLLASADAPRARQCADAAERVAHAADLHLPELPLALAQVAKAETRRTRAEEALELAVLKSAGTPPEALVVAERAEALELAGDLAGAGQALRQALELLAASGPARDAARWHGELDLTARLEGRLGALHLQQKDLAQARHWFDQSAHHWRLAQLRAGEARAVANLAAACGLDRDLGSAARWYGTAAEVALKAGDQLFAARCFLQQAKTLKRVDPGSAEARSAAQDAARLATQVGWDAGRAEAAGL